MTLSPKAVALAASMLAALSAATLAQGPGNGRPAQSAAETVFAAGYIDWVEKSDVSALRPGVIQTMELKVGDTVEEGGTIGNLHAESAKLTAAKAEVAALSEASIKKAEAQYKFSLAELARQKNLEKRGVGIVSLAEMDKAIAQVMVDDATRDEAKENKKLAEAELLIAKQYLKEHTITAPFKGLVIERMKHPGESVGANEPVIRLGKMDTLKFYGNISIESSFRVQPGMLVDVKPEIAEVDLKVEQKRFRGKVTYVSREILSVNKTEVTVFAEVQNNRGFELLPGMKATITVYLDPKQAPAVPQDALPEPVKPTAVVGQAPR